MEILVMPFKQQNKFFLIKKRATNKITHWKPDELTEKQKDSETKGKMSERWYVSFKIVCFCVFFKLSAFVDCLAEWYINLILFPVRESGFILSLKINKTQVSKFC